MSEGSILLPLFLPSQHEPIVLARNSEGRLLVSRCTGYQGVVDPLTVEILACRDATLLAREKNYQNVIVETDCLNVVQLWEGRLRGKSKGFHIFQEMQEELPFFQGFQLRYASRLVNSVAHTCAKEALAIENVATYSNVIPDFLRCVGYR